LIDTKLFDRRYQGNGQRQKPFLEEVVMPEDKDIQEFFIKDLVTTPEPYVPNQELIKAVNVALYLRRPLLLEGEPGCGKTRLAFAIAHELGYPLKECYIRSTSLAQELLYTYDGLRRLYDMQGSPEERTKALERQQYVSFGKLGEAIRLAEQNIPSVVLIDEIDKADIDFPNDLLQVLDRLQFEISEVNNLKFDALQGGREQRRSVLPLIIITSNREKELPKPFLRRCLYYYIQFPDRATLKEITKAHFHQNEIVPNSLFDVALTKFEELRNPGNAIRWRKAPGTGEMLDWISVLDRDEGAGEIDSQLLDQASLSSLPYPETLVKTQSDQQALTKIKPKDTGEI
jgi:MoxR-like ATPase